MRKPLADANVGHALDSLHAHVSYDVGIDSRVVDEYYETQASVT
jgi:hypothetical protein